jgi:arylsulfatase
MNDNGGTAGVQTYNAGMRGHKTQYYDGGHRAACFVRWPGGPIRKPCDLELLTQVQDILPTLIDLCALPKPKGASFDGTSLAGLLKGSSDTLPERMLVVQYGQVPAKWDGAVMWNRWRLVEGTELYNIKDDPGQAKDVAAAQPDVVKKMRKHYEKWWEAIEPRLNDFVPITIGSEKENPVRLSAADWANVYCDNASDVRKGLARNGPWHVRVDQDGTYEIELRRWPKEADANIVDGVPAFKAFDGGLPAGKALPIATARLKVGAFDEKKKVEPRDKGIAFDVRLKAGKTTLQTWFDDAAGKELCGAYFVYVQRK